MRLVGRGPDSSTAHQLATGPALAIECLLEEMKHGDTSHARIAAANALLDRGWGKPTQPLDGAPDVPPIGIEMSIEESRAEARRAIEEAFAEPVRDEPIV